MYSNTIQWPRIISRKLKFFVFTYLQINQTTIILMYSTKTPAITQRRKPSQQTEEIKSIHTSFALHFKNTTTALIMPTHSFVTDFTSHTRNVNRNRVHKSRWLCQFPEWNVRWVNQVNIYIGRIVTYISVCVCVHIEWCMYARICFVCLIYYNFENGSLSMSVQIFVYDITFDETISSSKDEN